MQVRLCEIHASGNGKMHVTISLENGVYSKWNALTCKVNSGAADVGSAIAYWINEVALLVRLLCIFREFYRGIVLRNEMPTETP
jgi:hypothetical protein